MYTKQRSLRLFLIQLALVIGLLLLALYTTGAYKTYLYTPHTIEAIKPPIHTSVDTDVPLTQYEQLLVTNNFRLGYAQGQSGVYFLQDAGQIIVLPANTDTFTVLTANKTTWAKDDTTVFYNGEPLLDADAGSFAIKHDTYVTDKNSVYIRTASGGFVVLPNAYPARFRQIGLQTAYYTDDRTIWLKHQQQYTPIPGVNAANFTLLTEPYFTDKKSIFAYSKPIKEAKAYAFTPITHYTSSLCDMALGKDRQQVYQSTIQGSEVLEFALPRNFEYIPADEAGIVGHYARDHDTFFMGDCTLQKVYGLAQPAFAMQVTTGIAKDFVHVYSVTNGQAVPIAIADPESFRMLSKHFAVDKQFVYYSDPFFKQLYVLRDADPATFKIIDDTKGADANTVFTSASAKYLAN